MKNLEFIHFQQLKKEIQTEFLKKNTPSEQEMQFWKGIDILFFQEDLRKKTKYSISERSFYNYFKNKNNQKLPRIDTLNLLSQYVGYKSWFEFKKEHLFKNEFLVDVQDLNTQLNEVSYPNNSEIILEDNLFQTQEKQSDPLEKTNDTKPPQQGATFQPSISKNSRWFVLDFIKKFLWIIVSFALSMVLTATLFYDHLFVPTYTYCFYDEDRNLPIQANLDIYVLKDKESPIQFNVKKGECFEYKTKDTKLKMIVNSAYYKKDTIFRNLENAPDKEIISLRPDEYAIMLHYYSKSIKDLKRKRRELNQLINDNALIYQVFDNDIYGMETLTKEKYITLITLPSTSLENLIVLETKMKNKKIVKIKFKIESNEK